MVVSTVSAVLKGYMNTLLFPKNNCLLCEKPITSKTQQNYMCNTCKEQLELPTHSYCKYCHKPMPANEGQEPVHLNVICTDCKEHMYNHSPQKFPLPINRSATLYNELMKELLALYKYRGKESLAKPFSYLLKTAYDQYFAKEKIDLITFVPLHPNRLQERGFNQAEQLAVRLGKLTGKPVYQLLERVKETEKQSKHTKKERTEQIIDSFQLINSQNNKSQSAYQNKQLTNKTVLIIDDIYTTGSTILECSKMLHINGVKTVKSLTLARAFDQFAHDKLSDFS